MIFKSKPQGERKSIKRLPQYTWTNLQRKLDSGQSRPLISQAH